MARPPIRQWNASEGLQYFCRHLVALCVTYRHVGREEERSQFAAYSGTLIQLAGQFHFLTAGHIVRDLEAALQSPAVEIESAVLADIFGLNRVSDQPIPFDLLNARRYYIDDREDGLDFGLISLRPYYVDLLRRNGVIALEEENWARQSGVTFDAYAMLGLPEEFGSARLSHSGDGQVSPTMFRVHRLAAPPPGRAATRYQQFIGQLDRELPIRSIVGMSGGPIFGFRTRGNETRYWVVALQSSWLSDERIVFGCSVPVLASLLTEWAATVGM
jgi:hypothetical protein